MSNLDQADSQTAIFTTAKEWFGEVWLRTELRGAEDVVLVNPEDLIQRLSRCLGPSLR